MKFRQQCGGFEDSMKGVFEVKDMQELTYILRLLGHTGEIVVNPRGYYDGRNGWDTHTVTVDGNFIGFTDGMYSCLGCLGTDGQHATQEPKISHRRRTENTRDAWRSEEVKLKQEQVERIYKSLWHLAIAGVGIYELRNHKTKLSKVLACGLIAFHADAAICDAADIPTTPQRLIKRLMEKKCSS